MNAIRKPLGALAIALVAFALTAPADALAASGRTVAVSATATLKVPNDTARAGFGVSVARRTRGAALREASARLRKIVAAVQAVPGVGAGDVRTSGISIRTTHRGKATIYRAGEGIGVTLHQPERAGELVQAAVMAGAGSVRGPYYFLGDPGAAYAKALASAFEAAKAKATTLATAAGATLGPALTITEGVEHEFTAPAAEEEESTKTPGSPAPPPTKPGTATVTATVSVVFELL